jgi:hypothetical protein
MSSFDMNYCIMSLHLLVSPGRRRAVRRRLTFALMTRLRSEVTFRRNGFKWTGPTASCIIRLIFVDDCYQDRYLEPITKWLRANTDFSRPTVVNIGAILGDLALPLSRTGKRVIAIEPNPESLLDFSRTLDRTASPAGFNATRSPSRTSLEAPTLCSRATQGIARCAELATNWLQQCRCRLWGGTGQDHAT